MSLRTSVLGCPVDLLDPRAFIASLPDIASGETLINIVTLNPEQIMASRRDPEIGTTLRQAQAFTIDGAGLALALRARGLPDVRRITGVDLVEALVKQRIPTYLLGGAPGAAEEAARRLTSRYPLAQITGSWSGGTPRARDDQQTIARIALSGARAVAVAYGAPAQTAWIERNRAALEEAGVRIAVGVGGSLDYHAGIVRRAPEWARRAGLEWLFRLVSEPWRLRRQLVLPAFAILALSEAVRVRIWHA
jgi:N-acetylglucosaminyldiphosphoundecaprenol N-acetyl-beta-D-mannosaminyltransferase